MKSTIFKGYGLDGELYTFSTCTTNPSWIQSSTNGYYFPSDNNVPIVYNTNLNDRRLLNDYAIFKDLDTYIQLPLMNLRAPFSFQILLHPRAYNTNSSIIEFTSNPNNKIVIALNDKGYIIFGMITPGNTKYMISSFKIPLNQWSHLTVIHDGTVGLMYFNGNFLDITSMPNVNTETLTSCYIANNNYNGFLDDIRIWNRILSPTEIVNGFKTELVGSESGLFRYYKLNNNFNDSTINNSHGVNNNVKFSTIERKNINLLPLNIFIVDNYIDYRSKLVSKKENNLGDCYQCLKQKCYKFIANSFDNHKLIFSECCTVPQWIEISPGVFKPGDNGNAFSINWSSDIGQIIPCRELIRDSVNCWENYYIFNGLDSYIELPNLNIGTDFTFEAWVYLKDLKQAVIFDLYDSLTDRVLFLYDKTLNGLNFVVYYSNGTVYNMFTKCLIEKQKTHIAIIWSANTVYLLINGNVVNFKTFPAIPYKVRTYNVIGKAVTNDSYWSGKITDIRFWQIARNGNDIKDNYQKKLKQQNNGQVTGYLGLFRYFTAIEQSGNFAADLAGYYNGNLYNVSRYNTTFTIENCIGCTKKQCYAFTDIDNRYVYLTCCENPKWLQSRTNVNSFEPGDNTTYLRTLPGWESTAGKILRIKNKDEFTVVTKDKVIIIGDCDNCLKIDTFPRIQINRIDLQLPDYANYTSNYQSINVFNKQVGFTGSDGELTLEYEKLSEQDKIVLENFYYFNDNQSFYLPLEILLIPINIQNIINSWKTKTFKFKQEPIIRPFIMNKNYQLYDITIVLVANID